MPGSSLRNTLARRNHKERAQPLHRQRLGILEKHKDYVQRARDYKSKQDRIKKLREKAAFRNKDEFYFGMVKGKTKGGVAIVDRGNAVLGNDVVKLLKTQDVGYVRMQIAKDEKKIDKLRAQLEVSSPGAGPSTGWDAGAELAEVEKLAEMGVVLSRRVSSKRKGKGKAETGHIVFANDAEEYSRDEQNPETSAHITTEYADEPDLGWEDSRPTRNTVESNLGTPVEPVSEEDAREHRMQMLSDLSALLARLKLLRKAESELESTKSHLSNRGGSARKVRAAGWVEDDTQEEDRNGERKRWESKIWKWKMERKR